MRCVSPYGEVFLNMIFIFFVPCCMVFCNVVLASTVELSRLCFELRFQLVVLCCSWYCVLTYFELSFKDFKMTFEKIFEKKMQGFGNGF